MMTIDELIKKNWEFQQQLNVQNKNYYEDLVIYLRAKGTFKNNLIIEEKALEILQDILDSQKEGVNAEEYFGKRPKEIADELLETVPPSVLDFLKLVLYALGAYGMFSLFPALVLPKTPIDFGAFAIMAVYSLGAALFLCWFIGTSVYRKKKKFSNVINGIFFSLLFVGGITLSIVIDTPYEFKLVGIWGILTLLVLLTTTTILFFRQSNEEKKSWAPFIPVITSCVIIGILSRISTFSQFFETTIGRYITAGLLILAIIIQYLLIHLYIRKLKNRIS